MSFCLLSAARAAHFEKTESALISRAFTAILSYHRNPAEGKLPFIPDAGDNKVTNDS
jgi:hypothetical protein